MDSCAIWKGRDAQNSSICILLDEIELFNWILEWDLFIFTEMYKNGKEDVGTGAVQIFFKIGCFVVQNSDWVWHERTVWQNLKTTLSLEYWLYVPTTYFQIKIVTMISTQRQ